MLYGFLVDDLYEQRLIERTKKGDKDAFELLVNLYIQALYKYLLFHVKSSTDANDIAQETMLSIWQSIVTYEYRSSFKTWMFSIAKRRLADYYRKNSRNEILPLTDFENVVTIENNLDDSIESMDVEQALTKLNSEDNELVFLVFQAQFSYQEISELLDIPIGTVKSRMSSIKAKLKNLLSWEGYR